MRFDKGYGMLHKEFWKISEELPTGGDMEQGKICIYSGDGHGKSPAALGKALQAASQGRQVVRGGFSAAPHRASEGRNPKYQKRSELCQKGTVYRRV